MKKERKMGPDHDGEPLSEVPVPGVGAVEICHPVEDVELQEVELNQSPLEQRGPSLNLTSNAGVRESDRALPFRRTDSRSELKSQLPASW